MVFCKSVFLLSVRFYVSKNINFAINKPHNISRKGRIFKQIKIIRIGRDENINDVSAKKQTDKTSIIIAIT